MALGAESVTDSDGWHVEGGSTENPDADNSGGKRCVWFIPVCTEKPVGGNSGGVWTEKAECTEKPERGKSGGKRAGRLLDATYVRAFGTFTFEPRGTTGELLPPS